MSSSALQNHELESGHRVYNCAAQAMGRSCVRAKWKRTRQQSRAAWSTFFQHRARKHCWSSELRRMFASIRSRTTVACFEYIDQHLHAISNSCTLRQQRASLERCIHSMDGCLLALAKHCDYLISGRSECCAKRKIRNFRR